VTALRDAFLVPGMQYLSLSAPLTLPAASGTMLSK
jgi:hypothetical protein